MSIIALAGLCALSSLSCDAQFLNRTLMHMFQIGPTSVDVTIAETPTGPRGIVHWNTSPPKERSFQVAREDFERMWSAIHSAGAEKYAGNESSDRRFDAVHYYLFAVAYMPAGTQKHHVVPIQEASPALISLATEFRKYAE